MIGLIKGYLDNSPLPALLTESNIELPLILYANRAFLELSGYGLQELIGQSPRVFGGLESRTKDISRLKRSLRLGKTISLVFNNTYKSGLKGSIFMLLAPIALGDSSFFIALGIEKSVVDKVNFIEQSIDSGDIAFKRENLFWFKGKERRSYIRTNYTTEVGKETAIARDIALAMIRWGLSYETGLWFVETPSTLLDNAFFPQCVNRLEAMRKLMGQPVSRIALLIDPTYWSKSAADNVESLRRCGWEIGLIGLGAETSINRFLVTDVDWVTIHAPMFQQLGERGVDLLYDLVRETKTKVIVTDVSNADLVPSLRSRGTFGIQGKGSMPLSKRFDLEAKPVPLDLEQALRLASDVSPY